jgi:hypothetical protein
MAIKSEEESKTLMYAYGYCESSRSENTYPRSSK